MKQLAVIAFAAILAFSACTQVEPDVLTARKVSFAVGSYAVRTKSESGLSPITERFNSRAFLRASGFNNPQNFFGAGSGEVVGFDGVQTWTPGIVSGNEYFWPLSSESYINFVCWYDKNGSPDTGSLSETSLSWTNRSIASDDVILYADAAWRYSDNNHSEYNIEAESGVPVLFHHALAQVRFQGKIKSGCDSRGSLRWEVRVKDMTLAAVYNTGSIALTNSDPGTPSTTSELTVTGGNWTTSGNASTIEMVGSTAKQITTTASDLLALRSVLPQEVTSDMVLSFSWEIRTYRNSNLFTTENLSFSGRLLDFVPMVSDWTMGHRITYTLEFDPSTDTIVFSPALDNWDNEDAGVVVE